MAELSIASAEDRRLCDSETYAEWGKGLSLEQYASLRAELAVHPEQWQRTLVVYTVMHQAALEALDAHWHRRFAEHPEERAAFETAVAQYTAWVRSRPAALPTDTPAAARGTSGP